MIKVRFSLSRHRMLLLALPLLAVAISALFAFQGNRQRAIIGADLQRHSQTNRRLSEVLILMVNAETGMRGYLLTQRDEFLEPYATASRDLPAALAHLRTSAEAEPGMAPRSEKLRRLNRLQLLINQQMEELAIQRRSIGMPKEFNPDIYRHLDNGKRLMDEIRSLLSAMQTEEELLLTRRVREINAIRQRDYLAIFVALFLAVGARLFSWHLFNIIIRRVKHLVENVRALRRGDPLPFPPSDKGDELNVLEREIARASQQFGAPDGEQRDEGRNLNSPIS